MGGQGGQQQAKGLGRVKNTYASVAEYLAVFEPLLFEEVKAQIVQGRSDEEEGGWVGGAPDFVLPPQFAVGLFNSVCVCVCCFSLPCVSVWAEAGQDWQKGIVASCTESEGFHKVSMAVLDDFREMVSENDLLLLSKEKVSALAP